MKTSGRHNPRRPRFWTTWQDRYPLRSRCFAEVMRQGRVPGSPSAFETDFGWVLAGETSTCTSHFSIASHHASMVTGDHLLRRFWEIEEQPREHSSLSSEECSVVRHFDHHHSHTEGGRFVFPLPKRPHAKPLGESRSQAVRRFMSLERSLQACSTSLERY